jgi:hypothetical protein
MTRKTQTTAVLVGTLATLALVGCISNEPKKADASPQPPTVPAPTGTTAHTPVAQASAPTKPVCKTETAKSATSKSAKTSKVKSKTAASAPEDCDEATVAVGPAPAPAPAAPASAVGVGGHYDLSKNKPVTDSAKVEAGQGTKVKGINDWEGEISGVPFPGAKFTKLKIGMSYAEATDLVGRPTDEGMYVTGKMFIPFHFGSDKARWEGAYKGQGRLIFSHETFGTGRYLIWIIYNQNERGYR